MGTPNTQTHTQTHSQTDTKTQTRWHRHTDTDTQTPPQTHTRTRTHTESCEGAEEVHDLLATDGLNSQPYKKKDTLPLRHITDFGAAGRVDARMGTPRLLMKNLFSSCDAKWFVMVVMRTTRHWPGSIAHGC